MATQEQVELARGLIETVERRLPKWRAWFPHEESEVEVARNKLLAIVAVAKQALPIEPAEPEPDITPEWLLEVGGWKLNDSVVCVGPEDGVMVVVVVDASKVGCSRLAMAVYNCGQRTSINSDNMTRDRFRALCYGLGIKLKGDR
jgi:hypothetical protein